MVRVEICTPGELGAGEIAAWHALSEANEWLAHPFLAPEFAVALSDRPGARVAVVTEGAAAVGFLVYERTRLGVGRPLARGLNIGQGLIHHPDLVLPERALLKACGLAVLEYDNWVPGSTAVRLRAARRIELPVVDFACGWTEYLKERHHRHRKYFRTIDYKRRRLERDLGPVEVRTVCGPGPAHRSDLEAMLHWKSHQYRLSGWPDPFADPAVRGAITRLAALDCAAVRAVLTTVRVGDRLIAADLSLTSGTVFAGWVQAHDPEYGRYSPGMVRTVETLRAAAELGVGYFALGRNDEGYKRYLRNDDLFVLEGRAHRPGAVAGLHALRHGPGRRARQAVLAHPRARSAVRTGLARYGAARERWRGRGH